MPKIFTLSCSDFITFGDRVSTNQHIISIIDTLDFQESIPSTGPIYVQLNDLINFHELVSVKTNKYRISLHDTITFNQSVSHAPLGAVTIYRLSHSLSFTQLLTAQAVKGIIDYLPIIETVNVNINRAKLVSQTLSFVQHAYAYIIYPNNKNATIDRIYTDPIVVNPRSEVTFTQGDNNSFALFRPVFGNQYKTQYYHIQKETLGRSLILAPNDTYPYRKSVKSLKMRFDYLKEQEADSFMAFINNNLGLPISIQDHEGIIYNGFISTPEVQIEQQDRNNRSLEFDFEIIPGP